MDTRRHNWIVGGFAAGLILAAVWVNDLTNQFLMHYPFYRPVVPDSLFAVTPTVYWFQYVADAVVVLSPLLLLGWFVVKKRAELPFVLATGAVAELIRGVLVTLTPLGASFPSMQYGLTTYPQYGQFPSGHTIMVTMAYLLIHKEKTPALKAVLLLLMIAEIVALILSRGHYSIDIVGGFLVAYAVFHELAPLRSRLTLRRTR